VGGSHVRPPGCPRGDDRSGDPSSWQTGTWPSVPLPGRSRACSASVTSSRSTPLAPPP
jgi:hypothetical protein